MQPTNAGELAPTDPLPDFIVRDWRQEEAFLAFVADMQPRMFFAIARGDEAIGGIGWGRGIMTAALGERWLSL